MFGKRTVLGHDHFKEFFDAVGSNLTNVDEKARAKFITEHNSSPQGKGSEIGNVDTCRLRCFTREEIAKKDDSLDLAWIRDDSTEDASTLPEPDVLINEAIEEMAGAMLELKSILVELGAAEATDEVIL